MPRAFLFVSHKFLQRKFTLHYFDLNPPRGTLPLGVLGAYKTPNKFSRTNEWQCSMWLTSIFLTKDAVARN